MTRGRQVPDWETLLAHAAGLQTKVPGAVLVGGSAAALHARHRYSVDHDHVVADLAKDYDTAIVALESTVGWRTSRRVRGRMVLGNAGALDRMNELYSEFGGEGGDMLTTVVVTLSTPAPYDLTDVDLTEYNGIIAPWDDWRAVEEQCSRRGSASSTGAARPLISRGAARILRTAGGPVPPGTTSVASVVSGEPAFRSASLARLRGSPRARAPTCAVTMPQSRMTCLAASVRPARTGCTRFGCRRPRFAASGRPGSVVRHRSGRRPGPAAPCLQGRAMRSA